MPWLWQKTLYSLQIVDADSRLEHDNWQLVAYPLIFPEGISKGNGPLKNQLQKELQSQTREGYPQTQLFLIRPYLYEAVFDGILAIFQPQELLIHVLNDEYLNWQENLADSCTEYRPSVI